MTAVTNVVLTDASRNIVYGVRRIIQRRVAGRIAVSRRGDELIHHRYI